MGNPLVWAVRQGDAAAVRRLVPDAKSVDFRDSAGLTPLMHAASTNSEPSVIGALLEAGATVGLSEPARGYTALHFAVETGYVEVVNALISAGASPDSQDAFGNSTLMAAVTKHDDSDPLVRCLLEAGANTNLENRYGVAPSEFLRPEIEETQPPRPVTPREPIVEHPDGCYGSAVQTLEAAFSKLRAPELESGRFMFSAQGQGHRLDSRATAEVEYSGETLFVSILQSDLAYVVREACVASTAVCQSETGIDVSLLTDIERARLLDALFRQHFLIASFADDGDYSFGVELM